MTLCHHNTTDYNISDVLLDMDGRTTIYLDPDLKKEVKKKLIEIEFETEDRQSLSSIVNILLRKWLKENTEK